MAKANLDPNFREFLKLLNSAKVKYLIVGGFAVNFYGHHRSTKDIDVWIAVEPENARRVSQVMQEFGGFPKHIVPDDLFLQRKTAFAFGREPVRIDLLTNIEGVDFEDCYSRRRLAEWDGISIPLIELADLRKNKSSTSRISDKADLESLPHVWPSAQPKKKNRRR